MPREEVKTKGNNFLVMYLSTLSAQVDFDEDFLVSLANEFNDAARKDLGLEPG